MDVQPITSLALLGAAIIATLDFVRYAKAKDWNGALTIFLTWVAGVAIIALAAQADVTGGLVLVEGQPALAKLDFASLALLGFVVGSIAPVAVKFFKAIDRSTTSKSPQLIADKPPAA